MEHMEAINEVLVSLLLGLLLYFSACNFFMFRRILKRNDDDHERFAVSIQGHDQRLTRVETKIESVETVMQNHIYQ